MNQNNEVIGQKKRSCCLCFPVFSLIVIIGIIVFWTIIFSSSRTNVLVLGVDSRDDSAIGRSDTIILSTILPSKPYIGMLSIPRDLWVEIPGYGQNRINTAHFFGEANSKGNGPITAISTIQTNFGIDVDHFIRLNHSGFLDLIDILGGIDIEIKNPMSGYNIGSHHMNGEQALAFVRDREGSNDFYRMKRGQLFLKALIKRLAIHIAKPTYWSKMPNIIQMVSQNIETNIPIWHWPIYTFTLLRIGINEIDTRIIDRGMVSPFVTSGGAYVLNPIWENINPTLHEMFDE